MNTYVALAVKIDMAAGNVLAVAVELSLACGIGTSTGQNLFSSCSGLSCGGGENSRDGENEGE